LILKEKFNFDKERNKIATVKRISNNETQVTDKLQLVDTSEDKKFVINPTNHKDILENKHLKKSTGKHLVSDKIDYNKLDNFITNNKKSNASKAKRTQLTSEFIDPENTQLQSNLSPSIPIRTINLRAQQDKTYLYKVKEVIPVKCLSPVYDTKKEFNISKGNKKLSEETFKPFFEAEEGNSFKNKMSGWRVKEEVPKGDNDSSRLKVQARNFTTYHKFV